MTRYDWFKLDDGWSYHKKNGIEALRYEKDGKWIGSATVEYLTDGSANDEDEGRFTIEARAQLAKCRIRDTEPAPPSERTTPTNAELMAQLERMQNDVDVMRTELAELRNPTDERDWQALTEENERLRDMVLERDLELSVAVERLKKLGWKEAE